MALPKSHRLSLRFERERLTKTGNTSFGKFFTLVSAESSDINIHTPRLAILLSKKTASLAVDRNRIRRITSSLLQNILSTIPPQDYLVIPKKQVLTENSKTLADDLQGLFKK